MITTQVLQKHIMVQRPNERPLASLFSIPDPTKGHCITYHPYFPRPLTPYEPI